MKNKKRIKNKRSATSRPSTPEMRLPTEDRLRIFANIMVDRIIEEEANYKEQLKKDPNAKRIYETCTCEKCVNKRNRSAT